MATYTFSPGLAYNVSTIGDAGSGIDTELGIASNVTATVYSDPTLTTQITVSDLNGSPLAGVHAGSTGLFSPFRFDGTLPSAGVYLKFGDLPAQFHPSDQALNSLPAAEAAAADAEASRLAAEAAISEGHTLDDILDVFAPSPVAGSVLTWDETDQRWEAGPSTSNTNAAALTTGLLNIERAPAGSVFNYDKVKGGYGTPAGSLPSARMTTRTDITIIWTSDTDPSAIAIPGDKWDRY